MADPSKINTSPTTPTTTQIKDLFPAHSRKIDILEQRLAGSFALSNESVDIEDRVEEEILDDSDEEDVCP